MTKKLLNAFQTSLDFQCRMQFIAEKRAQICLQEHLSESTARQISVKQRMMSRNATSTLRYVCKFERITANTEEEKDGKRQYTEIFNCTEPLN